MRRMSGDLTEDIVQTNFVCLNVSIEDEGKDFNEPIDRWAENRIGCVTNEVCRSLKQRRQADNVYMV